MTQFLPRAILIAASTAALAACASSPAPRYPIDEGQEPGEGLQGVELRQPAYPIRQRESAEPAPAYADDPAPTAAPSGDVEVTTLSPAPSTGRVEVAQMAPPPEPEPEPYVPPPPRTETRTVTTIEGPVVAVDGKPRTYTVKSGQGLDAIARDMGTTRKQLAADNDLKEPYRLKPGQVLKGPATKGKAYVVQSGDTLYAIARRFGVSGGAIAEENGFEVDDPIHPGQKLRLPEGFKDGGPIKKTITVTIEAPPPPPRPRPTPPPVERPPVQTPPAATPPAETPPAAKPVAKPPVAKPPVKTTPPKAPPVTVPPVQTPPPAVSKPPPLQDDKPPVYTDADYARMAAGRFEWPVRGTILSGYGPKALGQRNDGVDIGASAGTPVRASSDGTVVYSGGDVPGFGVTVLIQHADGWVTVYGHLQRADVKMQQQVSKGQQIGLVGQSGDAPKPQLHFEVRHSPSPKFKAKAIDPQIVLPK